MKKEHNFSEAEKTPCTKETEEKAEELDCVYKRIIAKGPEEEKITNLDRKK